MYPQLLGSMLLEFGKLSYDYRAGEISESVGLSLYVAAVFVEIWCDKSWGSHAEKRGMAARLELSLYRVEVDWTLLKTELSGPVSAHYI